MELSRRDQELLQRLLAGDRRALSRAITLTENNPWESRPLIDALYRQRLLGRAEVIGITGPPGAGKSTLTGYLIKHLRSKGKTVGVVLIDPSSPFTGGALLGDRVRMSDSTTDPGVFIRSMGSRGHLGGLSSATQDAVSLLDTFGMDIILIETVGIGQAETEIVQTADTTVVVCVPGLGDEIQIIKAGIMEIGDVFVVNKADRDGAEKVVIEINMMLDMAPPSQLARPPVIKTVANRDRGLDDLVVALEARSEHIRQSGVLLARRRNRMWKAISDSIQQQLMMSLRPLAQHENQEAIFERIEAGSSSPFLEAQLLLEHLGKQHS